MATKDNTKSSGRLIQNCEAIRKIIFEDNIENEESSEFAQKFRERTGLAQFKLTSYRNIITFFKDDKRKIQELSDKIENLQNLLNSKEETIKNLRALTKKLNIEKDRLTEIAYQKLDTLIDKLNINE